MNNQRMSNLAMVNGVEMEISDELMINTGLINDEIAQAFGRRIDLVLWIYACRPIN